MSEAIKPTTENLDLQQNKDEAENQNHETPRQTDEKRGEKVLGDFSLDELQPGEGVEIATDTVFDNEEAIREEADRMIEELLRANGGSLASHGDAAKVPSAETVSENMAAIAEANKAEEAENRENDQEALAKKTFERSKFSRIFKAFIVTIATVILMTIIAKASAGATEVAPGEYYSGTATADAFNQSDRGQEDLTDHEADSQHNVYTGIEALDKEIKDPFNGTNNPGCCDFEPEKKYSDGSIGNFDPVFELMGIDPAKATAEDYGKAYEYMVYSMPYTAGHMATVHKIKGFEDLPFSVDGMNTAVERINKMDEAGKAELVEALKDISSRTTYGEETANGRYNNYGVFGETVTFSAVDLSGEKIIKGETKLENGSSIITYFLARCANMIDFIVEKQPDGKYVMTRITINKENPNPQPSTAPDPKNQAEADKNSGANAGIVTPKKQERQITPEPVPDEAHEYDSEEKTYYYAPEEQADQIGYEVTYSTGKSDTGGETTSEVGPANDFDASASVGTGEVTGDTLSADGSGNTIQYNLDNATGNTQANPAGDYSEGF